MNEVTLKMPRYRCHKEASALKIAAMEIHEDKSATIAWQDSEYATLKTAPGWANRFKINNYDDPGYYVMYDDGYTNWYPTKSFEAGFTQIS